MGKYKHIIDIQQGGEHGRTALHLAAIYDHEECARILITVFDACPRKPCNNGYYPIHEAAKNASSKTMEVFFQVNVYIKIEGDILINLQFSLIVGRILRMYERGNAFIL